VSRGGRNQKGKLKSRGTQRGGRKSTGTRLSRVVSSKHPKKGVGRKRGRVGEKASEVELHTGNSVPQITHKANPKIEVL